MFEIEKFFDGFVFNSRNELKPFRHFTLLFCCAAFLLPLLYSLWTNHIWEDFFITFKFSKNLAEGRGLVYNPDIKVHGFTSPLGTLLPALCHWLTGEKSYLVAIWAFRIFFCIPAYLLAGLYFFKTVSLIKTASSWNLLIGALLFLAEGKSLVFSVNGMETAFMLLFTLMAFYYSNAFLQSSESSEAIIENSKLNKKFPISGLKSGILIGLSWAGLMWTRPDGFIFIFAIVASCILINLATLRIKYLRFLPIPVIVCTVVYLPWFLWAWIYYGSPVPNTVRAKGAFFSGLAFSDILSNMLQKIPHCAAWVFSPPYCHFAGWHKFFIHSSLIVSIFCMIFWISRKSHPILRRASLSFMFVYFYLLFMNFPYPWYFPPAAILALIVIAVFVSERTDKEINGKKIKISSGRFFQLCVLCLMLIMTVGTIFEMRIQQKLIETGNRKKIGEWLKNNMKQDESLYLECLGYIGYFSEAAKIYDYPGLASPTVVELIKSGKKGFEDVAISLEPDWIVARPWELNALSEKGILNAKYSIAKIFDVRKDIESVSLLPGRGYLLYDAVFVVLKKK